MSGAYGCGDRKPVAYQQSAVSCQQSAVSSQQLMVFRPTKPPSPLHLSRCLGSWSSPGPPQEINELYTCFQYLHLTPPDPQSEYSWDLGPPFASKMTSKRYPKIIKIRRPLVEVYPRTLMGIGFTLSPYPLSLLDPCPTRSPKTRKNT